jgi:UDP-N-acetylmuramate: L-alanyl-gamma-D-glutamyl-meso-diaminopimelate ligase
LVTFISADDNLWPCKEWSLTDALELDPALNRLPAPGDPAYGRFHLLGVGGVAMAALAGLLKEAGFTVSGSDAAVYPPMSETLQKLNIPVFEGYGPLSLPNEPTVVVVGNVVTRKFPVVKTLKERGYFYVSLPDLLGQLFLAKTKNIVVAGCHGKTTITNFTAAILAQAGLNPGYLIGGQSLDLDPSYNLAKGDWFVIEGDEYDSAFFQKVPKFVFYRPNLVILTGVEFDHADIYPDLTAVTEAYAALIAKIPEDGLLIVNGDDSLAINLAKKARSKVVTYGQNPKNDWLLTAYRPLNLDCYAFSVKAPFGGVFDYAWLRPGLHNALNAVAALAAADWVGVPAGLSAISKLKGVKRRQELIGTFHGVRLYDDFAHHPTAVAKTLAALKSATNGPIVAVFEPRSATSRRAVFQKEYSAAFTAADQVLVAAVNQPEKAPEGDRLDPQALVAAIEANGSPAVYEPDPDKLYAAILAAVSPGATVVLLSNGDFGGLAKKLALGLT